MDNIKTFKEGDNVRYIPNHAKGNASHPDCENGIVSSTNDNWVFVKYYVNGNLQFTAKATNPKDLMKFN